MFDAEIHIEKAEDVLHGTEKLKTQIERLQSEVERLEKEKSSLEKHQTKTINNLEERRKELQEKNRKQRQKVNSLQQEIYRLQGLALAAVSGELPSPEEEASEKLKGPEYLFLKGELVGNKIQAIASVRAMTGLELRHAKAVVESAAEGTPQAAQVNGEAQEDHLQRLQDYFDGVSIHTPTILG
jgi:ribosomal protein L7/L12